MSVGHLDHILIVYSLMEHEEEEEDKQIPFLDTLLVQREYGSVKLLVYRKKSHTDQYLNFSSHHPLNHKLAVIRTLLERCYSTVTGEDDRKKEEEHVAKALRKCGYPPWTIDRVKQDIVEKSLKDEAKKVKNTRGNHKGMVVVKQRLTDVSRGLQQNVFDSAVDECRVRLRVHVCT